MSSNLFNLLEKVEATEGLALGELVVDVLGEKLFQFQCSLCVLLRENSLSRIQRMVSFFLLLWEEQDTVLAEKCFLPFLIEVLDKQLYSSTVEQLFIVFLMQHDFENVKVMSLSDILKTLGPKTIDGFNVEPLRKHCGVRKEKIALLSPVYQFGINSTFYRSKKPLNSGNILRDRINNMDLGLETRPLVPKMSRPIPPSLPLDASELRWMYLPLRGDLNWDDHMCSTPADMKLRRALSRACKESLDSKLTGEIVDLIKENGLHQITIAPPVFTSLVEKNPTIAFEMMYNLQKNGSWYVSDYFDALVKMDLSLHSMEVVNKLTCAIELPQEFIRLYVASCINFCLSIKDTNYQTRLVRLVCVFLRSLIQNSILKVDELFIEVQAFCIEFSRIREAASLFRLLKSMEHGAGI